MLHLLFVLQRTVTLDYCALSWYKYAYLLTYLHRINSCNNLIKYLYLSLQICPSQLSSQATMRNSELVHLNPRNAQFTPPARHDKTVLSVSCLACRCELDNCYWRVQTSNFLSATFLSCLESNSHRRSGRDTDKTVLRCLARRWELAWSHIFVRPMKRRQETPRCAADILRFDFGTI